MNGLWRIGLCTLLAALVFYFDKSDLKTPAWVVAFGIACCVPSWLWKFHLVRRSIRRTSTLTAEQHFADIQGLDNGSQASNPSAEPRQYTPPATYEAPNLAGVRGWLLWFCIGATIITPAFTLYSVFADHPDIYSILDLAMAAFSVTVGINLWRVTPKASSLTKVFLIVQVCFWALVTIEHTVLVATGGSGIAPGAPRMLIFAIVWFRYFQKSKRVMATYGRSL